MIIGKDSFLLYTNAQQNIALINKYPFLAKNIGDPSEYKYDVLSDAVDYVYKHNLNFSKYNYLMNPSLKSVSLYNKTNNDSDYYSVYNFIGVVNFYKGIESEKRKGNKFDNSKECLCNNNSEMKLNNSCIAVLKETFNITPLSHLQISDLHLQKSSANNLDILICE